MVLLSGLCIYSFRFGSALNPDSFIFMNCRYGPWIFSPDGICLRSIPSLRISILSPTLSSQLTHELFFTFVTAIYLVQPIFSNLFPGSYGLVQIQLLLVRLLILCGMFSEMPMLCCRQMFRCQQVQLNWPCLFQRCASSFRGSDGRTPKRHSLQDS